MLSPRILHNLHLVLFQLICMHSVVKYLSSIGMLTHFIGLGWRVASRWSHLHSTAMYRFHRFTLQNAGCLGVLGNHFIIDGRCNLGGLYFNMARAFIGKDRDGGAGGMSKQTKVEVTAISQGVLVSLEAEEKKTLLWGFRGSIALVCLSLCERICSHCCQPHGLRCFLLAAFRNK